MVITTHTAQTSPALKVRFGRFEVDEAEARLLDDGEPVRLAPKPFAVLCALARTPHTLVTKSALLDRVWGHQYVSESVLKTTISDVRAVLDDHPKQPRYIETVSCRGYRFIGAVAPAAQPAPATPAPLPAIDEGAAQGSIAVGRAAELERLRKAWRSAAAGTRQVAWIAGEAGVGKTTLVERFVREVGGARAAHGHCVANVAEAERGLPILEALTELCRRDPDAVQLLRQIAPSWLARLPWLCTPGEREALRQELAEAGGPGRMLREFGELLDRYCVERPLLLVTEDLQWADPLTVQLLDYVARRRSNARFMWLATFRLTEVIASEHPLATVRQELRLHGLGQEILLDAFSPSEVADYLSARVPDASGDAALARAVYQRTDGLPLFVAALVDQLLESGEEGAPASLQQRLAAMPVPETLAGLVERYLHELTPKQRSVLEAASVCGTHFRLSTLADVIEGGLALLGSACAELVRRQRWLREAPAGTTGAAADGAFVFRHGVYREVLYKRLDRLARVELQRRLESSLDRERAEPKAAASIVGIRKGRVERSRCNAVAVPA